MTHFLDFPTTFQLFARIITRNLAVANGEKTNLDSSAKVKCFFSPKGDKGLMGN